MSRSFAASCIGGQTTLKEALAAIDAGRMGCAVVVLDGRFVSTLTDGDIRRAILSGTSLDAAVDTILLPGSEGGGCCITAPAGTSADDLLLLMSEHDVRHIPLLDEAGRAVDLVFMPDLLRDGRLPLRAVVMAGGFGKRLRPLTEQLPKPMLPVGGRPLLEVTLERMRQAGIHRCTLTTHYRGQMIREHFGDGSDRGLQIGYVQERHPLGTAGSLRLLENVREPLLVINGDVLTGVDFASFFAFHREQRVAATLGVRPFEVAVPFGVVDVCGSVVIGIEEKPVLRRFINAGLYVLEPEVLAFIPKTGPFDMPDLVRALLAAGLPVASYPITEYWQDIGQVDDYHRAQADYDLGCVGTLSVAEVPAL
jgi:dTDP-glucose pyrophosphorylase